MRGTSLVIAIVLGRFISSPGGQVPVQQSHLITTIDSETMSSVPGVKVDLIVDGQSKPLGGTDSSGQLPIPGIGGYSGTFNGQILTNGAASGAETLILHCGNVVIAQTGTKR